MLVVHESTTSGGVTVNNSEIGHLMEIKRKLGERRTSPARQFRRVVYGALGLVISAYIVLFIVVVTRHLDQSAEDELRRSAEESLRSSKQQNQFMLMGGSSLLGMEKYHERWAAVERVLKITQPDPARPTRRVQMCSKPKYRYPPGPLIALASFPGSGNTWIRFLVQQATGILTGSVYKDFSLKRNGFPAEHVANGSVLMIKTHEWGPKSKSKYHKAVLLIRDPYGALLAEFNRRSGGHIGHAAPEKFTKGTAWRNFVTKNSKMWLDNTLDWLTFNGPLLILRYEVMAADLPHELVKLLKFIDMNVSWPVFQCVIRNKDGIFRRARRTLTFDPFDESMKKIIEDYKAMVDKAVELREHGIKLDGANITVLNNQDTSDFNKTLETTSGVGYVEKPLLR